MKHNETSSNGLGDMERMQLKGESHDLESDLDIESV